MKKLYYLILFFLIPGLASALPAEFRFDTLYATPGDSIVIPLRVKHFQNAGSATLYIQYNTTVLSFGRALDWNPELQGSIYMASSVNNRIAVVWADINGATIEDDVFVAFKFRYNGGATSVSFGSDSEITDIWGNLMDPSPVYQSGLVKQMLTVSASATPAALCANQSSVLGMQISGGQGSPSFFWYSDPPGFASTFSSPTVSPTVTTTYFVRVYDDTDSAIAQVTVQVYPAVAPDTVTSMQPPHQAQNLVFPLQFSWAQAANASEYTLRIWEQLNPSVSYTITAGQSLQYTLINMLQAGKTYEWQVISNNPCYQTPGVIQSFTMAQLPDLIVQTIQTPPTAFSGQTISINYTIKNQGLGGSSGISWNDRVYLSFDQTLQTNIDYYVGTFSNLSSLNPQESYTRTVSATLPQGISGNYYFIVTTGNNISYPEALGTNNQGISTPAMQISLSPAPDLQVTQVVMPDNVFSGQPLTLSWTVKNSGDAVTGGGVWRDRIYFTQDTFFTASSTILGTFQHNGALAVDESYMRTATVTIPPNIFGTFYFYVVTDVFNQVYEHALENNNRKRSTALNVFLTPPADLVPVGLSVPASASNREMIAVSYSVYNEGIDTAYAEGGWTDSIYISNQPVLNTLTARRIGFFRRTQALLPGDFYSASVNCIIPSNLSGPHYIHVFSDVYQQVFEFDQEENNISTSGVIQVLNPDLVTTAIQLPDSGWSGQPVEISYYQKNNGPGFFTASHIVRDSLLISQSPVYDSAQMTGFGIKYFTGTAIPVGDSVLRTWTATLPDGISGSYYLYIITDKRNVVTEAAGESNNIQRSEQPIQISLTPWPDLVVENITLLADTIKAGSSVNLSYRVRNTGSGRTYANSWKDLICISDSPFGFQNKLMAQTKTKSVELLPDSAYTMNVQFVLPHNFAEGAYFIYVLADSTNTVYEHTDEGNNILRSDPLWVEPFPPTDLLLSAFSCPDTVKSGFPATFQWSVTNLTPSSSLAYFWYDQVYLSSDLIFNQSSDILVESFRHVGYLSGNSSYSLSRNLNVPNGLSGDYYVFAVTDFQNSNQDPHFSNNIRLRSDLSGNPAPVHIEYTAPSDLVVSDFTSATALTTGQPFTISWTVSNQGPGAAIPSAWTDKIYLSTNTILEANDPVLGGVSRTGGLQPDSSYSQSYTVTLPYWANGNYVLMMVSDANNQVYEGGSEANNVQSISIQAIVPDPGDLVVETVIPPVDMFAGEMAEVSWTVRNSGENPVSGKMSDIVYLSKDTVWDSDDIFFATYAGNISLGSGASLQRSITSRLENLTPGNWYVLVKTNVLQSIHESDYTNNTSRADAPFAVSVPLLPLETWVSDTLNNSQPVYYQLDIPAGLSGETLRIRLEADSVFGNNELYFRYGEVPSRSVFDYGYSNPGSGNQEVLIPSLSEGTYYLLVYGNTLNGNSQNMRLHAGILEFVILGIEENQGGNGEVTVKLTGAKFTPDMQVFLRQGENKIYAVSLLYVNSTRVYPTFNLNEVPVGKYSVAASRLCDGLAVLEDAFDVVEGSDADLQVTVVSPAASVPGAIIPVRVEFANAGNTNLVNPSRTVINLMNGWIARNYDELSLATDRVHLFFEEPGGPAGILRPGVQGSVVIYSQSPSSGGNIIGVIREESQDINE